jgi:hypothetical protein
VIWVEIRRRGQSRLRRSQESRVGLTCSRPARDLFAYPGSICMGGNGLGGLVQRPVV